ncbi:MAG: hypothetical protein JXA69_14065 [Phycisphaerae bacterium]|nr:hypothetical protein [Phycisphaerae bacterium]
MPRRDFLKHSVVTVSAIGAAAGTGCQSPGRHDAPAAMAPPPSKAKAIGPNRYDGVYVGERNNRVAFPMGGIGAGMLCLEGTGTLTHVSLRNKPEIFNEPNLFAAICVKGRQNVARVLEGPVPAWKIFGQGGTGNGASGKNYGLPRFAEAVFETRFPFGTVRLKDKKIPLDVAITGWSPFEPSDADNASLPVAGLEYQFRNVGRRAVEAVFSFNATNFMGVHQGNPSVRAAPTGFILSEAGPKERPWEQGSFSVAVTDANAKVNAAWFRGGWFDPLTIAWKDIEEGACFERPPVTEHGASPGGTVFVPLTLKAGETKTVTVQLAWFVGETDLRLGKDPEGIVKPPAHTPWYAGRFKDIDDVVAYWREHYDPLRTAAKRFSDCFYDNTLPPEVTDAVAANLTILKSPTVLRQADGRLWGFEGCCDAWGCCHGSCTHVWNYAQAICHLFPSLERSLRETEFKISQDDRGHQAFRTSLPIRPTVHDFHAAADGQLGGIMKAHREWRISGDTEWLRGLWPAIRTSLDYCIKTWDPKKKGVLEEPHHNTYDIEFWGPDGMCTSFYLGALAAAVAMGNALNDDVSEYAALLECGTKLVEFELFNGEYYIQKIQWEGLEAPNPADPKSFVGHYSPEALELLKKEGPKYQYGIGCLSDGVLGSWMALVCGVGQVLDKQRITSHLKAVHKHNLKLDLSEHANPQRPAFACGAEGGLLLCTWPRGGALSLPFVYSNEVWTGIEYQVAAHLMMMGCVAEGLDIVRACRDRYDGRVRNPFNEYECGHWYARAMSSYAMLQGLSGARYDAIDKVLYLEPNIGGDFRSFIATATGYGTVGVKNGKPFLDVVQGKIDVRETRYAAKA